jgi:surface antigen
VSFDTLDGAIKKGNSRLKNAGLGAAGVAAVAFTTVAMPQAASASPIREETHTITISERVQTPIKPKATSSATVGVAFEGTLPTAEELGIDAPGLDDDTKVITRPETRQRRGIKLFGALGKLVAPKPNTDKLAPETPPEVSAAIDSLNATGTPITAEAIAAVLPNVDVVEPVAADFSQAETSHLVEISTAVERQQSFTVIDMSKDLIKEKLSIIRDANERPGNKVSEGILAYADAKSAQLTKSAAITRLSYAVLLAKVPEVFNDSPTQATINQLLNDFPVKGSENSEAFRNYVSDRADELLIAETFSRLEDRFTPEQLRQIASLIAASELYTVSDAEVNQILAAQQAEINAKARALALAEARERAEQEAPAPESQNPAARWSNAIEKAAKDNGWSQNKTEFMAIGSEEVLKEGGSISTLAGIAANVYGESSYDMNRVEGNNGYASDGEGYGYVQWSFGRKADYFEKAKAAGVDVNTENPKHARFAIRYLIDESQNRTQRDGSGNEWKGLIAKDDPVGAAGYFQWNYERPAHENLEEKRATEAQGVFDQIVAADKALNNANVSTGPRSLKGVASVANALGIDDSKISKRVERNGWFVYDVDQDSATLAKLGIARNGNYPSKWMQAPLNAYVDANGMYTRQCVSYVGVRVDNDGKGIKMPYWGGKGDAHMWIDNAKEGWRTGKSSILVDDKPAAGAAIAWDNGTQYKEYRKYGHVGYVERVFKDGSVLISEMNAPKSGQWNVRVLTKAYLDANKQQVNFIHFEER